MDNRLRDGRVRVFVKGVNQFSLMSAGSQQMYKLGTFAVAEVLRRIGQALGPNDTPAKPLSRYYAVLKAKRGLGNRRNLRYTGAVKTYESKGRLVKPRIGIGGGHMLDNLRVRTVSENSVRAGFSAKWARDKALGNTEREPFLLFSPKNQSRIVEVARRLLITEKLPGLFGPPKL